MEIIGSILPIIDRGLLAYRDLLSADALYEYLLMVIKPDEKTYVFLDEIQNKTLLTLDVEEGHYDGIVQKNALKWLLDDKG